MPAYYNNEFAAVILPGNTAEVQALVKLCNKHKQPFRPICTGWSGSFPKGMVLFDLRRMNHIIEINEKIMYAVVEPYVVSAELQAELHEKGFELQHERRRRQLLGNAERPWRSGPDHQW